MVGVMEHFATSLFMSVIPKSKCQKGPTEKSCCLLFEKNGGKFFFIDSKGLAVFDLWLKLWKLWTVKKYNRTLFWESLFCNFNKNKDVFFTQTNGQKIPKTFFKK